MKIIRALVWTTLSIVPLQAEHVSLKGRSHREAVVTPLTDIALPTLIAGGEFRTAVTILNLSASRAETQIFFVKEDGGQLELPIVGIGMTSGVRLNIPAKGSVTLRTEYLPEMPSVEGWGFVVNDGVAGTVGKVGGYTVVSFNGVETVTPFQPVVEKRTLMPFDNRDGIQGQVVVINFDTRQTASVSFTAYDEEGNVVLERGSIEVPAIGRLFLGLDRIEALKGRRGVIEIETSLSFMATYGYRFNAETRQWSSIPSISLVDWQAR